MNISLRDKWRLPLILVRVSKSLHLRESDAKIWACFIHNKTQAELIEYVATAPSARIPSESKKVLRSAAHSALLPQDCPFPTSRSTSRSSSITSFSLSGWNTPVGSACGSQDSSKIPSRAPSPGAFCSAYTSECTITTVSPTAATATTALSETLSDTASTTSVVNTGTSRQRLSTKLGLPPLTPPSHGSAGSVKQQQQQQQEQGSSSTLNVVVEDTTHSPNSNNSIRSTTSSRNSDMWPARLARYVHTLMSRSCTTSPHPSPRKVVPTATYPDDVDDDVPVRYSSKIHSIAGTKNSNHLTHVRKSIISTILIKIGLNKSIKVYYTILY